MSITNVSIIMPAYNSSRWISDSIQSVLDQYYEQWELLIVDDGSTDQTAALAQEAGAVVIRHLRRKGYDHAINSGIEFARRQKLDAVITFDADGQHQISEIDSVLAPLIENKADIVLYYILKLYFLFD